MLYLIGRSLLPRGECPPKTLNRSHLNSSRRRRWRGVPLGGHLQRGAKFCFTAHDGEANTAILAEWMRPGCQPTAIQMVNGARALRSIGARKSRREAKQWIWTLSKE